MSVVTDLASWPDLIKHRIEVGPEIAIQPILDLLTADLVGYEALSRFPETPGTGPDEWFRQAQILDMDRELEVAAVTAALHLLPTIESHAYLGVNASARTLLSEPFVMAILARFSDRIVVELTEHDAVGNYEELRDQLSRIRKGGLREGVRLGIDDVGAGFASMKHILQLDPDIFKLDISLVRGIDLAENKRQAQLVAALAIFASSAGITIVAEGIETDGERQRLRELGVRNGQGYLLGRPTIRRGEDPCPIDRGA